MKYKRSIVLLAVLNASVIAGYVVSPWLIVTLIKSQMTARGVTNVQLQVGYPGWHEIRLSDMSAQLISGMQKISIHIPLVNVEYSPGKLLDGKLERIHVPRANIETVTTTDTVSSVVPSVSESAGIPLAVLFSGQWLNELPIDEIALENFNAQMKDSSNILYTIDLKGHLHNRQLELNGEIHQPKLQQALLFSLSAQDTGSSTLLITSTEQNISPMLEWRVNSAAIEGEQLELAGNCKMQIGQIAPIIAPWISTSSWLGTLGGALDAAWQARLPANWENEKGQIQIEGDASVKGITGRWALPDAENALSLTDGLVTVRGSLNWSKSLRLQGMVRLKKLAAQYHEMTLTGLSGEVPIVFDNGIRTRGDARMTFDLINVGFPVDNTEIRFELLKPAAGKIPVVKVKDFTSHLLGGDVRIEPFEYDVACEKNNIMLNVMQLPLAKIIELEQQEGITGDGLLDGRIPIELSGKEISVTEGKLSAREPGGVIRYAPTDRIAALAENNTSIGMMVKALSNFQYKVLDVTTNYNPNGDLSLQVRLEGKNPDWQGGQPVNLNLNLQENIPTLLRSLQLSDEISEKVRKHYQKTP